MFTYLNVPEKRCLYKSTNLLYTRKTYCQAKKFLSGGNNVDHLVKSFRKRLKKLPESVRLEDIEDLMKDFASDIDKLKNRDQFNITKTSLKPNNNTSDNQSIVQQTTNNSPTLSGGKAGQVLICQGKHCCQRGSKELLSHATSSLRKLCGNDLEIRPTNCMKRCEEGPTVCIRPQKGKVTILTNVTSETLGDIVCKHTN